MYICHIETCIKTITTVQNENSYGLCFVCLFLKNLCRNATGSLVISCSLNPIQDEHLRGCSQMEEKDPPPPSP